MAQLVQTIYVSLPTLPANDVILDIVRAAEARNERLSVSGLLFYSDFAYMQLLEGPAENVGALYDLIERDYRHGVVQAETRFVGSRLIAPTLPMGYVERSIDLQYVAELHNCLDQALEEFYLSAVSTYPSAAVSA